MSTPPPPPAPVPARKRGLGCCGIGCIILALLALLFVGMIGTVSYVIYSKLIGLTSPVASTVKSYDGGDELYRSTQQKLADFNNAVKHHQAATLELSADEINTLIARNPDYIKSKSRLFVSMKDTEVTMQCSVPTSLVSSYGPKDRYLNGTISFGIDFDTEAKEINFDLHAAQIGDKVILGDGAENLSDSEAAFNQSLLKSVMPGFCKSFNDGIKKSPDAKAFLDNVKSIEIKDSELVIESN